MVYIPTFSRKYPVVREKLTAARTYYVRTDGDDGNDGLTNSSGGAFATIDQAFTVIGGLDIGVQDVTIQLGDTGSFAGATLSAPFVGSAGSSVTISGDTGSAGSYVITSRIEVQNKAVLNVSGINPTPGVGDAGLYANSGGVIKMTGTCIFGTCTNIAIYATGTGSTIDLQDDYTIDGDNANHWAADFGAKITANEGTGIITVTLSGTPNWSGRFCYVSNCGTIRAFGITFSGSATGKRYDAYSNGAIETFGSGASYLPGDSAGATDGDGVYN